MALGIRLPAGVRDFLPRAAARRRAIAETLLGEFERWGYDRIITPMFECADVLELGLGADAREAAIRFVEPGTAEVVALRPDITAQVARVAATRMGDVDGPIRLCYEGAVTRLARGGARTQREVLQAGVELIDAPSPEGDAEAIAVAAHALAGTGVPEARLDVGHVALVQHCLSSVDDPLLCAELEALLTRKDRPGVRRAAAGLPAGLRAQLEALPTLYGEPDDVLARARALRWPRAVNKALDLVEQVLAMSAEVVEHELHSTVTIDLGEVHGFDYYTGLRFAGYAAGVGHAILRGGRYDELVGRYGRQARATGFAVDIEAVADAQQAAGIAVPAGRPSVLVVAPDRRGDAARIAAGLRRGGHRAAVDLGRRRGARAVLRYARGVGFTSILSIDSSGARAIDVASGDERRVPQTVLGSAARGQAAELAAALGLGTRRTRRA
jgi:ATP phosphoribosyltransferase regulatory subunit